MTKLRWVYDLETYPNIFTMTMMREDGEHIRQFEVSDRKNDTDKLLACFKYFAENNLETVGYNNTGFDYPILHEMILMANQWYVNHGGMDGFLFDVELLYGIAQDQIRSFSGPFGRTVREKDCFFPQVDLYKIHHFDNAAKATSLKMLEFNMKSESLQDLPFPVGTVLNDEQKDMLLFYNLHDVKETLKFYVHSKAAVDFRVQLSEKLGFSVMNFNDTKIGKEFFAKELEKTMPGCCYKLDKKTGRRQLQQTKRDKIVIKDCLFNYYDFKRPEFIAVFDWFQQQVISETKGVFTDIEEDDLGSVAQYANLSSKRKKFMQAPSEEQIRKFKSQRPMGWVSVEQLKAKKKGVQLESHWMNWRVADTLNVVIDGFQFDFGTGGIHGSISSGIVRAKDGWIIKDADVASMYPNLGISNKVYPEHLSVRFCEIYQAVYEQRQSYKKGTPENAVMKLALNGVYGDSNNKYSPFYDPKYTMAITINGQLSLCLLAEKLMTIKDLQIIQVNTDGVTVRMREESLEQYNQICKDWMQQVKLELEFADYSAMYIRDVNNYIAVYTNGKVKRKGAYQYEDLGWHQNHSCLVVPKAAEAAMLYGADLEKFIRMHTVDYDFMLRTKVDRSSKLVTVKDDVETEQQRICRYYACKSGSQLVKIMKPLAGKTEDRRLHIDDGWNMRICNEMKDYDRLEVDYDYYIEQAKKLILEETHEL